MIPSGFSGVLSGRIAKRPPVDLDEFHAPRGLLDPLDGLARLLDLEFESRPRLDEALNLVGIPPRQTPAPGQDAEKETHSDHYAPQPCPPQHCVHPSGVVLDISHDDIHLVFHALSQVFCELLQLAPGQCLDLFPVLPGPASGVELLSRSRWKSRS